MKIILSPSKTMDLKKSEYLEDKELLYPKETKKVLASLRKLTKKDIAKAYKIDGDLLSNTYQSIKNYTKNDSYHAFPSFTGLVYFNIDKENYKETEYEYIKNHVRILDALYGVLEPGTLIKPYRLDMKTRIGLNLYKHWNINSYFDDELVINLASKEFSQMVYNKIDVEFYQESNGEFKSQATFSKMARGKCLDYMVKHNVQTLEELKRFNIDGYQYNEKLSSEFVVAFSRIKSS